MNAIDYAEQAQDIFVLSDSFLRIKELIDSDQSTIDDISDVVLLDPALSGTLLKLANSSFFNYPGKIDTISKAILVLGITEVYHLVIAYFTNETFKQVDAEQDFLDHFWSQAVDCALVTKFLGNHLKVQNAERLFILGLLHNMGELVVQQLTPQKVLSCNALPAKTLPWVHQQEVLGFTFGECSAELLKLWQLPFSIVGPIREQDNAEFDFATLETKLLYIAKRLTYRNTSLSGFEINDIISSEKLAAEGIDEQLLAKASAYCDMERLGILAILNPSAAMIF